LSTQSSLTNEANFCVAVSLLSGGPAHNAGLPLASRFDSTEPLGRSHPRFRLLIFSVLFHFVWVESNGKDVRHVRSGIEDLAFTNRFSRESDKVGRRGCIEHDFAKGLEIRTSTGTEDRVVEVKT
jgi:hypothetical protein